jgi:hypothetical protein
VLQHSTDTPHTHPVWTGERPTTPPPATPPPLPPPHPKPLWAGLLHAPATQDGQPGDAGAAKDAVGGDPLGLFADGPEEEAEVSVFRPLGVTMMVLTLVVAVGAAVMHGRSPPAHRDETRPLSSSRVPTAGGTFDTPRVFFPAAMR